MSAKIAKPSPKSKRVSPVKVVIVDDHPAVRKVLGLWIARKPELSLSASVGTVALARKAFADHDPGLAIVDLELPDGSGIDLIKTLRETHPRTRVLVFSMQPQDIFLPLAMKAGAHGFVNKSEPPQKVFDAIGQALRRERRPVRSAVPKKRK